MYQKAFWLGETYIPAQNEFLLNYARTGIVMALRAALPDGGKVGVVAYNCYTVANAVVQAGCTPVFVDVTEDLHVDIAHLKTLEIDAMVITNLFGIRNDVDAIREVVEAMPIIVDNAHGYGLPNEGDFTIHSINQGKFPALGEGGILVVNNLQYAECIKQQHEQLPEYSIMQEVKLFVSMLVKAMVHLSCIYTNITMPLKARRTNSDIREETPLRQMAKGIRRIYKKVLPTIENQIENQLKHAKVICEWLNEQSIDGEVIIGGNAFMAVVRTTHTHTLQQQFAQRGIETATHFAKSIDWAKQFGYQEGNCPMAEQLTKELLMIPTYKELKL